jgi:O-antigen/teichoic acid export membrane protein
MSRADSGIEVPREKVKPGLGGDSLMILVVGISAALPFLLAPLRAQVLGPAGRGEFAFFQSSLTTVAVASALGVRIACYQVGFLSDNRFTIGYFRMGVLSIVSASFLVIPLTVIAFMQFSATTAFMIAALVLLAPSFVINQIEFATASYGHHRGKIANASSLPALIEFVFSVVAFAAHQYTLLVGVFTAIFAQVARLVVAWKWHLQDRGKLSAAQRRRVPRLERALYRASLKNAPAAVIPLLSGNLDVLIFGTMISTDVLGHYVVAKLGFTALLIVASVFEGRAIGLVTNLGRIRGLITIGAVAGVLVLLCGTAGWVLTPIVFGPEFVASAYAFPLLATAGGLAFVFVCVSAVNAQANKASLWPGATILLTLIPSCVLLSQFFGPDVVVISLGLVTAQGVGTGVVLSQYFSRKGKHL